METPFGAEPAPEVPLTHAPLVRVIAQLRFPLIASIEREEFIGPFQEAIRETYPILRAVQEAGITVTTQGDVSRQVSGKLWRFHDKGEAWSVTLAPSFVALQTTAYTSREEFLRRFLDVVRALEDLAAPVVFDRLGIRYVDRIQEPQNLKPDRLSELVRRDVLGIVAADLGEGALAQSLCITRFELEGAALQARWGYLPSQATIDAAVEPLDKPSWVLDLDMFSEGPRDFAVDAIAESSERFASTIYRFFRWAVTEEFLREYGGTV